MVPDPRKRNDDAVACSKPRISYIKAVLWHSERSPKRLGDERRIVDRTLCASEYVTEGQVHLHCSENVLRDCAVAVEPRLLLLSRYEGGNVGAVNGSDTAVEAIQDLVKLDTLV